MCQGSVEGGKGTFWSTQFGVGDAEVVVGLTHVVTMHYSFHVPLRGDPEVISLPGQIPEPEEGEGILGMDSDRNLVTFGSLGLEAVLIKGVARLPGHAVFHFIVAWSIVIWVYFLITRSRSWRTIC